MARINALNQSCRLLFSKDTKLKEKKKKEESFRGSSRHVGRALGLVVSEL